MSQSKVEITKKAMSIFEPKISIYQEPARPSFLSSLQAKMISGGGENTSDRIDSDMQGKIDDGQLDEVLELNSETTNSVKTL